MSVCSEHKVITELIDYEEFCGLKAAGEKVDIEEISILDLKNLINEKEPLELIDVRPSSDFQIQHIEGSKNIPFAQLAHRVNEIETSKKVVIVCKIGFLSKQAILELDKIGFKTKAYSLSGGITSWLNSLK